VGGMAATKPPGVEIAEYRLASPDRRSKSGPCHHRIHRQSLFLSQVLS
jgi:hypothetical protein